MTRFKAAIFDLDGTLIDTERLAIDACLEVLHAQGFPVAREVILTMVGVSEAEGHRRLTRHLGRTIDLRAFDADWGVAIRRRHAAGIPVMAGADTLLSHLFSRAIPRAVATNSYTANAHRKLAEAGLAAHFDPAYVVGFDLVPHPKPAPDVFLEAAARLGIDPADCVAFEDSEPGVAAALAAGMTVVHIPDMAPVQTRRAHHHATTILDGARACGLIV